RSCRLEMKKQARSVKSKKDSEIKWQGVQSESHAPGHSAKLSDTDSSSRVLETDVIDTSDGPSAPDVAVGHDFTKISILPNRFADQHQPQTKLNVSDPGDPLEEEADRMADQIMGMAETLPGLQLQRPTGFREPIDNASIKRQCEECETE